ncbi:MAG: histidine--tRNA ligase [Candidatus Hodarchaeales archaeon]|jgi:histidyl-tRNA synthetase
MVKSIPEKIIDDIKRPRGTRDFMPKEIIVRKQVENEIRKSFELFGFQEIQTPIFETIALFELRSGEKFRDDVYHFIGPTKEQQEGGTVEYCLRPELTAPTCRFFVTGDLGATPKPLKAYYIGPCFRYDKPAPGRYREFYQAGIELFGSDSVKADAEVVTVAAITIKRLGIQDFRVQINDLNIIRKYLDNINLDQNQQSLVLGIIDNSGGNIAKCRLGVLEDVTEDDLIKEFQTQLKEQNLDQSAIEILTEILGLKGGEEIIDKALTVFENYPEVTDSITNSGLKAVFAYLKTNNIDNVVLDFSIARGLDYYTGLVFEIDVDKLGAQKQVCGGGRYDKLVAEYGGHETPATGFAFGIDRLVQCAILFNSPILPQNFARVDVFLKVLIDDIALEASISTELRNAGIRLEIDLMKRGLKKALSFASKMNIPFALILGKKELENKQIQVRNLMKEPWTQEVIQQKDLISYLQTALNSAKIKQK